MPPAIALDSQSEFLARFAQPSRGAAWAQKLPQPSSELQQGSALRNFYGFNVLVSFSLCRFLMTELKSFPVPANESQRLRVVEILGLDDKAKDPFFDTLAEMARDIYGLPVGLVSIVTETEQRFAAHPGLELDRTPRSFSLCALAVAERAPLLLHDTHLDLRTVKHPVVTGSIMVRSYFGMPIVLSSGFCVGTVCALGPEPSTPPTDAQLAQHRRLADLAVRFLERPLETGEKRAEEIADVATQAQEEFLSLVGHELRTPLTGICGLIEFLEPKDADEIEVVDAISASAELLGKTVESILAFTELKSGDIQLQESRFDLVSTLRQIEDMQRHLVSAAGKSCDFSGLPASLPMTGDESRLSLAFSCLMANFVAHGGKRIVVSAAFVDDGSVELNFTDDGEGIGADRREKVLQAFGVGRPVRQRLADGIGLGLPLTRRMVELHGGTFMLEHPYTGLLAELRLPAWRFAPVDGTPVDPG